MSPPSAFPGGFVQGMEPSQLLAYDVAEHSDAPMDTGGEKPDLGDR